MGWAKGANGMLAFRITGRTLALVTSVRLFLTEMASMSDPQPSLVVRYYASETTGYVAESVV